jgi:hypothetical protein
MKRFGALAVWVVLAVSGRAYAACPDGATRRCGVAGRSGTRECVNGQWTPCRLDEPLPTPPPDRPPLVPEGPVAAPPHEVRVASRPEGTDQRTAWTDCCVLCEEQTLEAVTPSPTGPRVHLDSELAPLRQTFCGTVTDYGVNDERADPRDITINLRPLPIANFPDFVAGLIRTASKTYSADDRLRFGRYECNVDACAARAAQIGGKTIHAEITPDEHFYGQDAVFLPIDSSGACDGEGGDCVSELEPERGADDVCVHGVYAIDHGNSHGAGDHRRLCCFPDPGHDHPEIHPFDAIWWKDPRRNGWVFGVFQDDSNRYSSPHCGDNNGANWSQAPRDVTFRFPFRFKRSAGCQRLELRHVRSTSLRTHAPNTVRPVNVTTSDLVGGAPEVLGFLDPGPRFRQLVQVRKEEGSQKETHVRVEAVADADEVSGDVVVRVAVGTVRRTSAPFTALRAANPLVTYTDGDPGAGYYYAELFFAGACTGRGVDR